MAKRFETFPLVENSRSHTTLKREIELGCNQNSHFIPLRKDFNLLSKL